VIHPHLYQHHRTQAWSLGDLPATSMHRIAHTRLTPYAPCSQHDGQTATYIDGSTISYPYGERIEEDEP
jgi:hypothetical protein